MARGHRALHAITLAVTLAQRDVWIAQRLDLPIPVPLPKAQEVPMGAINEASFVETVRATEPDLVVTAGAPLLGEAWFGLARFGCLNVHFGISPAYRGEHTLFYALKAGDADGVGVTLHRIDAGVDTGPIFCRAYPALDGNEGEVDLWAKCARVTANMLPSLVHAIVHERLQPCPQQSTGRNIRYRDRRFGDTVSLWLRRPRLTARPEQIVQAGTCDRRH